MTICSICGGSFFVAQKVLWPELIAAWRLSEYEAAYIDEQQGRGGSQCGANLRVVALGEAVRDAIGTDRTLEALAADPQAAHLKILDLNGACAISGALAKLPKYMRADFPQVDMHALPSRTARWHRRVHVGQWAAACAAKLDGDFVECGVNRGFLSSSIMAHRWPTCRRLPTPIANSPMPPAALRV
jgi:hypothetical protein